MQTMEPMKQVYEFRQQALSDALELYIYDDVEKVKIDWAAGEYVESKTSAEYIRNHIENSTAAKINVYINSRGGSVMEGNAIYNILKRSKAYKTVYIDGFACSIASVIAMAGDWVVMPRNTVMMIHEVWMEVAGNAAQLRKAADDTEAINMASRQAYLAKSNGKISEETLIALMAKETFLTAQECIDYGLADEFGDTDADMDKARQMLTQSAQAVPQQAAEIPLPPPNAEPELKTISMMQTLIGALNKKGE